jgi:hypothetical protein
MFEKRFQSAGVSKSPLAIVSGFHVGAQRTCSNAAADEKPSFARPAAFGTPAVLTSCGELCS